MVHATADFVLGDRVRFASCTAEHEVVTEDSALEGEVVGINREIATGRAAAM